MQTFETKINDADWDTKIDAIAKRLGVDPEPAGGRNDGQMRYLITVKNGERKYNLLDMVHALLDRIDAATPKK